MIHDYILKHLNYAFGLNQLHQSKSHASGDFEVKPSKSKRQNKVYQMYLTSHLVQYNSFNNMLINRWNVKHTVKLYLKTL